MPRPRIITNEMIRAACNLINRGETMQAVAARMGVHPSALRPYLRVVKKSPRKGKVFPKIELVQPIWPTQATATPTMAPAPYARGYRW